MVIIDNGSRHTKALAQLLHSYQPKVVDYGSLAHYSLRPNEPVILSGGHNVPIVLWHNKWYQHELAIIEHHPGLLIGICLGAELMAHFYGSHLRLLPSLMRGSLQPTPTQYDTLGLFAQKQHVYEAHR